MLMISLPFFLTSLVLLADEIDKVITRKHIFLLAPLILVIGLYILSLSKDYDPTPHSSQENIFSSTYPVHSRFVEETSMMRASKRISSDNENLIQVSSLNAGKQLGIPQSLLWCLMFQESRLNHLSGVHSGKLSTGLGQFSNSAFFELNNQLNNYLDSPRATLSAILGTDIRPLTSDPSRVSELTSYYFIPTAVTATALYLHNRFIQLSRIADKRHLNYTPDILWAWSAVSYNKGSRSVLAIWNQIESKEGIRGLEKALTERDSFLAFAISSEIVTTALQTIWSRFLLASYSKELITHVESIRDCALIPQTTPSPKRNSNDSYRS